MARANRPIDMSTWAHGGRRGHGRRKDILWVRHFSGRCWCGEPLEERLPYCTHATCTHAHMHTHIYHIPYTTDDSPGAPESILYSVHGPPRAPGLRATLTESEDCNVREALSPRGPSPGPPLPGPRHTYTPNHWAVVLYEYVCVFQYHSYGIRGGVSMCRFGG